MLEQFTAKVEHRNRLARRLVVYILLFSSIITLFGTAFQLHSEFKRDIQRIDAGLDQVEKSHLGTIISSLWIYNLKDLKVHLNGILQLPDVQYVEIKKDDNRLISVGGSTKGKTTRRHFELMRIHRGQQIHLGTLTVTASLENVRKRLIDRVIIILSTQAIKTFLVTTFIFTLFYYMIGRHLESMALQTSSLNLETLDKPLKLERHQKTTQKDELDQVTDALNDMRTGLQDGLLELKRSESATRESELKFRQLAENIPEVFWLCSPDWHNIFYISPAYETIWGNSCDSLYLNPMSWIDSIHKADQEKIKTLFPIRWAAPFTPYVFPEYKIVRTDGSTRWIRARAFPIVDETGKVHRIAGIAENITERKEAARKIQNMSRLLMGVTEGTTDAIFIKDIEGHYLMANSAACRAIGKPQDDVIGRTDRDLFPVESSKLIRAIDSQVIHSGKPLISEERLQTSEGHTIWLSNKSPHLDINGNIIGIIGISRDITLRKKAEQEKAKLEHRLVQAQKMESIGNLAGGIAHDFNNLLCPIVGMSEMLMEDFAPGSLEHENAHEIFKAGKRGSDLVKQILSFSRQDKYKVIPVSIQKVLNEVLNLGRSTIPSNIDIRDDIQQDCGLILADPTQLHQIGMNLITNAYHAVEKTNGTIEITLKEVKLQKNAQEGFLLPSGRYAQLTVTDNGGGIHPDNLNKIFEPYFTTKGKGRGTGLGLSVVFGIIKEHKGDIKVYSEINKGTTFTVYLPLIKNSVERSSFEHVEKLPSGTERILLVDDEKSIVRLETKMLERLGYTITSCSDSLEALKTFEAEPSAYDLIITDMTMPRMTGDQLAAKILSLRSNMPIIVCTGFSENMSKKHAESLGIKGYLMKPVIKSEVAKMVRKILDASKRIKTT